ncbi:M56 family metallopeptidase [Danxiaibacter flavus]|uniref:M56 family metallopeptidase n=1 Tax=Danxiaibacter flavus TaxID=3049108 RepID=A0ABV3Z8G9_9BACT|nr:M56 family metallopeptidase [Chitinophagaceae bacterium DXS]
MPALFEYILKMSLCIGATYLFYHFALRRITHYQWNRWFLLLFTLFAFMIPVINIGILMQPEKLQNVVFIRSIPTINSTTFNNNQGPLGPHIDWWKWIGIAFMVGTIVLVVRLLIQLYSLKRLQNRSELLKSGPVKIFHVNDNIAPFSFHQSIYLNKDEYNEQELQEIVQHELVHVQQKHTIDMLIAEFVCICNWYNPFAWLIKKAIKENLEFIADEQVLNAGADHKAYQYLLLKVGGNTPLQITNNLNFSSLKKRIYMMNKGRTGNAHLLKFFFIVPVICMLLVLFRGQPDKRTTASRERTLLTAESFSVGKLTYFIKDPAIEAIIKNDQPNSLLKPGGELSLSLMQDEKSRLTSLLKKKGYSNIDSHAITFMMDTSFSAKNFSVQIIIDLPANNTAVRQNKSNEDNARISVDEILQARNNESVAYSTVEEKDNTRIEHAVQKNTGDKTVNDKTQTNLR